MRWSWKIGRIAGISIYIHATFLLLLGWIALVYYLQRESLGDALKGLIFIITLFSIVVLHELGHALAARHFGIRTHDITLLPIGGVARLERIPTDPRQEVLVALAGPAVNVVLAALLFIFLGFGANLSFSYTGLTLEKSLNNLLWVNVSLAVFNLLPAFPMDGGRVLRGLLAMRMEYVRATQIAANLGQGMALLFGFVGLLTNPFLVFIALFVWIGAAQEASIVQARSALTGIPISHLMAKNFHVLSPEDSLARARDLTLTGSQRDFPIVADGGHLAGVLTGEDLLRGLTRLGAQAPVAETMRTEIETASPDEMLDGVCRRLQCRDCHSVPVLRGEELAGFLTMDNIGQFLMFPAGRKTTIPHPASRKIR